MFQWVSKPTTMYIAGATLSVDTFFVMAGTVLVYTYMKAVRKGIRFNVPLFYLHRWLRYVLAISTWRGKGNKSVSGGAVVFFCYHKTL